MLQTDILPTSQLPCTATFCELRKSKENKKYAEFHFKHPDDKTQPSDPVYIDIGTPKGMEELAKRMRDIDDDKEESPYDRVEIYYPFPILEVRD